VQADTVVFDDVMSSYTIKTTFTTEA
jgi:hypothetical protein